MFIHLKDIFAQPFSQEMPAQMGMVTSRTINARPDAAGFFFFKRKPPVERLLSVFK
jgi:hypothetical protein